MTPEVALFPTRIRTGSSAIRSFLSIDKVFREPTELSVSDVEEGGES